MQTLRTQFPNGPFGDPALYLWDSRDRRALLFDCGDLSRFTTRQLLRVSHLFISHCHMDHLFGFDLLLRVHMGEDKTLTVFGPPDTSKRIGGKLQGYTWNLTFDQSLAFEAIDLDPVARTRTSTWFRASDQFLPTGERTEPWDPASPLLDARHYVVRTAMLDHRTPSMAYVLEQKPHFAVDAEALARHGLRPGDWIEALKNAEVRRVLQGVTEDPVIAVETERGVEEWKSSELASRILLQRAPYKVAYATDGAASAENREALLSIIRGADLFYCETCFLKRDERAARDTKHFTADFVARVAGEAGVRKLAPFHFSKRYVGHSDEVLEEVTRGFPGTVVPVRQENPRERF